jgi:outer membrane protein assembly factor BamA
MRGLIVILALGLSLPAQTPTRTASIEAERDRKQGQLKPEENTKPEKFLIDFQKKRYLERFTNGINGFRAKIGNMATGAGFALGPEFILDELNGGRTLFRISAQAATSRSLKFESALSHRPWNDDRMLLEANAFHRNYNRMNFYGLGPESEKTGRTVYRLEDTSADFLVSGRIAKYWKAGGGVGLSNFNTGPGVDRRFATADATYRNAGIPGLDRQTDFWRTSLFGQIDYRDNPNGPKSGGNYVFQQTWLEDRTLGLHDLRRLDIALNQYLGFFNRTRVLALGARATYTDTRGGQSVPFYLMPALGGSDDLRGYRFMRFADRNMLALNAEYRWEIFSGLDGAIFADAGKVAPRRGLINFKDLESSAGFGFRFNVRNSTFIRIDTAFSHEGFQVWFKFNDPFLPRPFRVGATQPVY